MNHNRNSAYRQNGFTLIELIVVFTVIAILSTIGTVSFVSYSRTQNLNQAAIDLVQNLNLAKSLSASQLKILDKNGITLRCFDYQTLNGYGIEINPSQKYYDLYLSCVGNGVTSKYTNALWQISLPKDVIISSPVNVMTIFFPVLSGGIISTGGNSVVLQSKYSGVSQKTINFSQGYISVTSP